MNEYNVQVLTETDFACVVVNANTETEAIVMALNEVQNLHVTTIIVRETTSDEIMILN